MKRSAIFFQYLVDTYNPSVRTMPGEYRITVLALARPRRRFQSRHVTRGGALRDETKNGCEGDSYGREQQSSFKKD